MKRTTAVFASVLLITLFAFIELTQVSCSKAAADNKQFVGTYVGNDTLYESTNNTTTVQPGTSYTIAAGSSGNAITISIAGVPLNGTVSGNTLTIPAQANTNNVGYGTWSGSGTLTGNSLSLHIEDNIYGVVADYSFLGSK